MKDQMRDDLHLESTLMRLALAELTWLPVASGIEPSDDLEVRALRYAPVAGALVGLVAALVLWTAALVVPYPVALVLAVIVLTVLQGGRDLRGLSAAVDGLTAGRQSVDTLTRLSLPGQDAAGALAMGLALALKLAVLVSLPATASGIALIVSQALAQMARVHVKATTLAARRAGMKARLFEVTDDGYRLALAGMLVVVMIPVLAIGPASGLGAALGAITAGQVMRWIFVSRLGGYTREGLAAMQVMSELGGLLGLVAAL